MGDVGDAFRALRDVMRERKERLGVDCPRCIEQQPRRIPTRLLPGQRCKVCKYRDPRPNQSGEVFKKPARPLPPRQRS